MPQFLPNRRHSLEDGRDYIDGRVAKSYGTSSDPSYVFTYPRLSVQVQSDWQQLWSVWSCYPVDRFSLNLTMLHNSAANPAVPAQFDLRICGGFDFATGVLFEGTTKFTSWQDTGPLVQVAGVLVTQYDLWVRIPPGVPADGYDISLVALIDKRAGQSSLVTEKNSDLMV